MNLGKNLLQLATAPVRIGLAVADAGLQVAGGALGLAHRTVGDTSTAGSGSVAHSWASTTPLSAPTGWPS